MPRVTTEKLERGVKGTVKTIKHMHRLVQLGKLDPTIQKIATWIRLQVPNDYRGSTKETADAVFRWMKRHQVFMRDPFQIEKIEHPIEAMRPVIEARKAGAYKGHGLVIGDCDTLSAVFLNSLLGVLGFQYAFETVKVDKTRPDDFSHVSSAVLINKEWYPLDPSTRGVQPGWRPPVDPELLRRWPEKEIEETLGMGMNGYGNGLGTDERQRLATDDWPEYPLDAEWLEHSQYGYGIPKSLGNPRAKKVVPMTTGGRFEYLLPSQPALSRSDLERPLSDYTKRFMPENLTSPGRLPAGGFARPNYVQRGPYIRTQRAYPPGSRWNYPRVQRLYDKQKPYIHSQPPRGSTTKRVDVVLQDPIPMRRRRIRKTDHQSELVFMRPNMPSASLGNMGQEWLEKFGGTSTEEAQKLTASIAESGTAKEAASNVWDTINSVINTVGGAAAEGYIERIKSKYRGTTSNATANVTGVRIPPTTTNYPSKKPTTLLSSPWLYVGGALVIAGVGYAMFAGKGGAARPTYRRRPTRRRLPTRRLRRRNPVMRYRRRAA